jgi:hypothetical protein
MSQAFQLGILQNAPNVRVDVETVVMRGSNRLNPPLGCRTRQKTARYPRVNQIPDAGRVGWPEKNENLQVRKHSEDFRQEVSRCGLRLVKLANEKVRLQPFEPGKQISFPVTVFQEFEREVLLEQRDHPIAPDRIISPDERAKRWNGAPRRSSHKSILLWFVIGHCALILTQKPPGGHPQFWGGVIFMSRVVASGYPERFALWLATLRAGAVPPMAGRTC